MEKLNGAMLATGELRHKENQAVLTVREARIPISVYSPRTENAVELSRWVGNPFDLNGLWCHIGTMPIAHASNARVVARVPEKIRSIIQMAADLTGAPLNQFLVQTAYKEAKQILERESLMRLSESQARQVFELLDKPPKPNAKLKRAAQLFKTNVRV